MKDRGRKCEILRFFSITVVDSIYRLKVFCYFHTQRLLLSLLFSEWIISKEFTASLY